MPSRDAAHAPDPLPEPAPLRSGDERRLAPRPGTAAEAPPEEQASEIAQFVHQHATTMDAFADHCDYGMSRSHAIGAAFCYALLGSGKFFFDRRLPNPRVYDPVLRALRRKGEW